MVLGTVQTRFELAAVVQTVYADGGIAINLEDHETGEPIARLSVNIPDSEYKLKEGQFFVKTWSENELIIDEMRGFPQFRNTGIVEVLIGQVGDEWFFIPIEVEVWEVVK